MNEYLEAIRYGEDVRNALIAYKKLCREDASALQALQQDLEATELLVGLLSHEDAKVRKNAALLLGEQKNDAAVAALMDAYETEQTRFVKGAYLQALNELDVTPYLDTLRQRYEELLSYEPSKEEQKHVDEERDELQRLLFKRGAIKKHTFNGYHGHVDVIFTTEEALREPLKKQLEAHCRQEVRTALHPFGVRVRTEELARLCKLHTYRELLFPLKLKGTIRGQIPELSKALLEGGLLSLLERMHREKGCFYFRLEVRGIEEDKKASFIKALAHTLERDSCGGLYNSATDYEVEIRLTCTRDGSFYPCLKLYTITDDRFAWRGHVTAASMHPSLAAALIELARPYLDEQAVVLDALCGVGTFVIERNLRMKTYDNYAVDLYGEAIEGAKENAVAAAVTCNFVKKDITQFSCKHHMTEIYADMPRRGKRTKEELDAFYSDCFNQFVNLLAAGGHLFLYATEEGFVKKNLRLYKELALLRQVCVRKREDGCFYIIEKRDGTNVRK